MLGLPTDQSFREIAFDFLRLAMEHGHMIANTNYGISWYTKKMGKHGMPPVYPSYGTWCHGLVVQNYIGMVIFPVRGMLN